MRGEGGPKIEFQNQHLTPIGDCHRMSQIYMYAKIFKSMFDGTLRGKSDPLLVFVNLLANADKEGFVDRHFRAISDETGIPIDRVEAAVTQLESPDDDSRTQELQGRRLERIDEHRNWGWRIVNYLKYRKMQDEESRRESQRERQRACRARKSEKSPTANNGKDFKPDAIKIIALLNEKSGRDFRNSDCSLTPVMARLAEPDVTVDGVMKMVERQVKLWKGDGKMEEYLRPGTLFGKEKFNAYYAARELPINKGNHNGNPQRVDRSIGTANEGTASQYKGLGKVS